MSDGPMVQGMHDLAVGNGWVTPSEFWNMTPGAFWWLVRAKMPDMFKAPSADMSDLVAMVKASKRKDAKRKAEALNV